MKKRQNNSLHQVESKKKIKKDFSINDSADSDNNNNKCSKQGINIVLIRKLKSIFQIKFNNKDINCYDIKNTIKEWTDLNQCSLSEELKNNYMTKKHPYLDLTYNEGCNDIATLFVSYSWSYSFYDLVNVLEKYLLDNMIDETSCYFWLDFAIANQWPKELPPEWWATAFRTAVQSIGTTLLVLIPWNGQSNNDKLKTVLDRTWSLYECYITIISGCKLVIGWNQNAEEDMLKELRELPDETLFLIKDIDVLKSSTTEPADQQKIFSTIRNDIGYDAFNKLLTEVIQKQIESVVINKLNVNTGVNILFLRKLSNIASDKVFRDIFCDVIEPAVKSKNADSFINCFNNNSIVLDYDFNMTKEKFSGPATVYVSHPWSMKFSELVEAIENFLSLNSQLKEDDTFFFIDCMCKDQFISTKIEYKYHSWVDVTHFRFKNIKSSIHVIDKWEDPSLVKRCWLLFELQLARMNKVSVNISTSFNEQKRFQDFIVLSDCDDIQSLVSKDIDFNSCEAVIAKEKKFMLEYLSSGIGGIDELKDFIELKRLEWMIHTVENQISKINFASTKKVDQVEAAIVKDRLLSLYRLYFKPSRLLLRL